MPFRFIHTADLHLDSPLASLALRNADLGDLVRGATRKALERIVDLAIAEEVDMVIVAGDLYDGSQTSMATALFLMAEMRRLEAAGIRVFIIRGNHDAQSQITRELTFPPNVHVFDGRGKPVKAGALASGREVHVHGISFAQPHAPNSLLPAFRAPVPDAVNIGLMHTSLAGASRHDPYAPVGISDLAAHGFDYWALGHIHQRRVHSQAPWIVMPGNPQGRDINEGGPKSVTLATVAEDGTISCEERPVAIAVFERLSVDLSGIEDWHGMLDRVETALGAAKAAAGAHLVARLSLTGTTPLGWRLRRDEDLLSGELQNLAASLGDCWIEAVELAVVQPQAVTEADAGPLAELGRLMHDDVAASHAYREELRETLGDLLRQLPREARSLLAPDEAAEEALLAELALHGADAVLARLGGESGRA
ncbi:metallophosphoesterase family protein [Shinella zoogloeoides]|uniref:DNA repair exonuclease n=1 Tax=Shinella zoogloeoides TaxID=352475 RepID=A0A6N8T832_SHIZO|nr:DNA repair exonuclease [Shinella zoogloeoides]MXN99366.1 DNA repair exonuclease [Shinella zoogloeoides]UEX82855.1 DNA repair exonuclease [Shinella zoogloeoides]